MSAGDDPGRGGGVAATASGFLLDDPDRLRLVVEGAVDVFLVPLVDGRPGPRTLLFTAGAGTLLPGIDRRDSGHALLAVPEPGTRLRESSRLAAAFDGSELSAAAQAAERAAAGALSLVAVGPTRAEAAAGVGDALNRLDALLCRLLDAAVDAAAAEQAAEREWLARRAEAEQEASRAAVREALRSVGSQPAATAHPADPLLAACRLVGGAMGLDFREPRGTGRGRIADPVEAIVATAAARHRRVRLHGEWWKLDAGPLLGFLREGGRPVALLRRRRGYVLADPADGGRTPVDAGVAATLEERAHTFTPPLPERSLRIADLPRFGIPRGRDRLALVLLSAAAASLLGLALPLATGHLFADVIPDGDGARLLHVLVGLLALSISGVCFDLTRGFAFLGAQGRVGTAIQSAIFDRLIRLPPSFFRGFTVGDLVSRLQALSHVRTLMSGGVTGTAIALVTAALNVALLFYFSPRLGLAATLLVCAAFGIIAILLVWANRIDRDGQDRAGRTSGFVLQLIEGVPKLRVAAAERRAFAEWLRRYSAQVRLEFKGGMVLGGVHVLTGILPLCAALLVFAAVGWLQQRGATIGTGTFVGFYAALGVLLGASAAALGGITSILDALPHLQRLEPILVATPEPSVTRSDPGELRGGVEASHLRFRYRGTGAMVLDDVSFEARPGEHVALVGPSGSGKSTVLRLLLGFETPLSGAVYYDGRELATIDVKAVRRQLGVVLQGSRVQAGDIFRNIAGSAPLSQQEVWDAAEQAGLADDIRSMPMGLRTLLPDGGGTLSGGQVQRLLIARALARKPRILYFDEATSALDNISERVVRESLDALRATRLSIAHRLNTVRRADRIYVLREGKVVEVGGFDELMRRGGEFARLAARQLA